MPDIKSPDEMRLNSISSFLPDLLILPINLGLIQPESAAFADRFESVLLFADISGFTALAERLERQGAEGAEQLTVTLNRYFGAFIDLVHAHGGDVAKFAGDALLAVWRQQPGQGLESLAALALQCGAELQQFMQDTAGSGGESLRMKVAISSGSLQMACIGGVLKRKEMVLSGAALAELGFANDLAEAGDTLIYESAKKLLPDFPGLQPLTDKIYKLISLPSRTQEVLRHRQTINPDCDNTGLLFIPAAIRQSISANQADWINENRQVTVLFVNLNEFATQLPIEVTQQSMAAMQTALYRFEGSVNKISVDDKGVSLMGVLGMPPFSHGDDPLRAVQAALLISRELTTLGLGHQIGISTGTVFCGVVGNNARREYTMMGDAVNLSARLMQKSASLEDGTPILMDERTALACGTAIAMKAHGEIMLKGKSLSISIYQPEQSTQDLSPQTGDLVEASNPGFVGRSAELAQISQFLSENNKAGALIVQGATGSGRASLLAKALAEQEHSDAVYLNSRCEAMQSQLPWAAWQPVFKKLLVKDSAAEPSALKASILARLESEHPELLAMAPLLEAVCPAQWEDNEATGGLTGAARVEATADYLARVLEAMRGSKPLVIRILSAEWLDSASLRLLGLLVQSKGAIKLLLTHNSEKLQTHIDLSDFVALDQVQLINLPPLSDSDQLTIARSITCSDNIPEAATRLILERSSGSPMFAIQITRALMEAGWLKPDCHGNMQWLATSDQLNKALPASIDGLIISRIDRLAPEIQLTGKVASVVGRRPSLAQVGAVHPMKLEEQALLSHLNTLHNKGLIESAPNPDQNVDWLRFSNDAIAISFYKLLPGFQRRQLHRQLAESLEKVSSVENPQQLSQLAFHWRQSCDPRDSGANAPSIPSAEKACYYLLEMARRAVRLGASVEAEIGFEEVLKLCRKLVSNQLAEYEVEALLGLSATRNTRFGWGDAKAAEALEKAIRKSAKSRHRVRVFQAIRGLWQVKVARSDYQEAMNLAQQLCDFAEENPRDKDYTAMGAEAARALGTTYFWLGDFKQSEQLLESALKVLSEQVGQSSSPLTLAQDTEVSARGILAWALALTDQEDKALAEADRAVQVSEELGSEFTKAYARGAAMWTGLHLSNQERALHYARLTLELSEPKGYAYFTAAALVVKGWAKVWSGDPSGLETLTASIKDWRDKGQTIGVPAFLLQQARALKRLGRLEEAQAILADPLFEESVKKEPWIGHLRQKMMS